MFASLASALHRRRVLTLLLALVVTALAVFFSSDVQQRLSNGLDDYDDPGGANVTARHIIQNATGVDSQQGYVLLVRSGTALNPAVPPPAEVRAAETVLHQRPEVKSVLDYASTHNPGLISADGRSTLVVGNVGPLTDQQASDGLIDLQQRIQADPVLRGNVEIGGATPAHTQLSDITTEDLGKSELIATPILLVLLVLVFRGVVAALLPMIGGVFSILLTLLGMRAMTSVMHMSSGGLNLAVGLGLGLSIDFSLLIVTRYREELARQATPLDALRATVATAGRTVAFSGLTVTAALATLLVFPQPYLRSMGIAGVFTVVSAALFALIVLPALLALLGRRVNALAPKRWQHKATGAETTGRWHRLATFVMRRAALFAGLSVLVLLVLASPVLNAKFAGVDPSDMPTSVSSGQVANATVHDFADAPTGPLQIVLDAPADAGTSLAGYRGTVGAVPGVTQVGAPTYLGGGHWELDAVVTDPSGDAGYATVRAVEALHSPYITRFTGETADLLAQRASLGRHLPIALILLVAVTLLLLFVFTGSVVLPIQALALNALSVGAAFGILTWVFQLGHLAPALGVTQVSALEETSPILLFALAFGLSTDYNLFLLGRVKEAREQGVGDRAAAALGIERTGRTVTSAAILFCIAVGALFFSRISLIRQLGLGTTMAVLLDATIIRAFLVPALLGLLGRAAWWAPKPLLRLRSALRLDRMESDRPVETVPAAAEQKELAEL
ncbi:MAG TPA: MMPL family transporter [Pseudonocardiaceae bacterium]|jgi:RND superfamily putative drug exporter